MGRGVLSGAVALGALALNAIPRIQAQLPAPEDVASALLTASGVLEKMQAASIASADKAAAAGTDSAVWSAFLNAAKDNTQDGSIGQIAKNFATLQDGDVSGIFNSALPNNEVDPSSIFTADLGTDNNINLANGAALFSKAFGVSPDTMQQNLDNPAWWGATIFRTISGKGGDGVKVDCAWTATVSYEKCNISFPDQNSVYHLMYLPQFGPSDVVMIEGEYPDSRYFSVQSYDDTFSPIKSLRDLEVEPYQGLNPFAQKTTTDLRAGRYKIFLTKSGKMGFPNELALANGNFSSTSLGLVIFRLYGIDPLADTKNQDLRFWGYKDPPIVATKVSGGMTPTGWDAKFQALEQCPEANSEAISQAVQTIVQGRPDEDAVKETQFEADGNLAACKIENTKDGFMLMSRDQSSSSRAPFINADANYLMACANSRSEYLKSSDLIAVVRNNLPRTPYSKFQKRYVGDAANYDVRYASLSVYDLKAPAPVYKSVSDDEFRNFYYDLYGAQAWEEEMGRNVSMVVSTSQDALARCKVDTSESFVVTLDGQDGDQKPPQWWGVVYRELVSQSSVISNDNAAAYGLKASDIYKKSVTDAKNVMCPKDGTGCDSNPYRTASIMKEHYPRVEWFTCSPSGVLASASPLANVAYDTAYASKAVQPRADQYFNKFCPGKVNSGLLEVYSPTTVTMHAYNQAARTVPANTVGAYGISKITNEEAAVVVGVSVKAYDPQDAYFKAQVSLCGYSYVSNPKWRCISHPPSDDQWLTAEYDDSAWEPASMVEDDYVVPEFDRAAKWITVGAPSVGTYCRLVIPNPTYLF